ncbi:MAG: hydroxymethylglutaryl-CoA reductase, degradative [Flavobacteriaceae bacterium]|nr:hydroxymethylglutaryl-CoA reductase, degradative [Flavobacteriaceae bacterium]MCY4215364.1 hydroxymethylglutaryl-CoA reductase, degradative [Flavobacteriaceae bacterium]MCY4253468.1 hydroxymethylglutaryl-CoA reductase, degradative [Flavobacteriaceae bacterium]
MNKLVQRFSKISTDEKIKLITQQYFENPQNAQFLLTSYLLHDKNLQEIHSQFSENNLSNFVLPFSVAPNFLINQKTYCLPMVTEESSVVAAAANAAKFWYSRGGFKVKVLNKVKSGQIHFTYNGNPKKIKQLFERNKSTLIESTDEITHNMRKRGGGIQSAKLVDMTKEIPHYYQIDVGFKTGDAMGANFINTCLEKMASTWTSIYFQNSGLFSENQEFEIIMSILSNYTPDCVVSVHATCPIKDFGQNREKAENYAKKFVLACQIALINKSRAVTHNKGILNGIDAVVMATGNDFRSIEASIHSYASKDGSYKSLSTASINQDIFHFEMTIPLSIGTVGGLTKLHPMVRWGYELLGWPNAEQLMEIIAASGLAQNFAAINSLITTGIQKGHMKMHLNNILNQLGASKDQKQRAIDYFHHKKISVKAVDDYLKSIDD